MSTDKIRALHTTLAEIFREPPLISTNTEPSPPTFFDEEPYDAAQERGEVTTRADQNFLPDLKKVSAADIGLTHKDIHEAPKIHDAEKESPALFVKHSRNKPLLTLQPMREIWRYGRSRQSHCSPDWTLTPRSASAGLCAISEASERNCRLSAKMT
jgi:hypothetical protein